MNETRTIDRPALIASLPAELKERFEEAFTFIEGQRDTARQRITLLEESAKKKDVERVSTRSNFLQEIEGLHQQLSAARAELVGAASARSLEVNAIVEERERQRRKWGDALDDTRVAGELIRAACVYALHACAFDCAWLWPFGGRAKVYAVPEHSLAAAGALILAEMERRARARWRVQLEVEAAKAKEEAANTEKKEETANTDDTEAGPMGTDEDTPADVVGG